MHPNDHERFNGYGIHGALPGFKGWSGHQPTSLATTTNYCNVPTSSLPMAGTMHESMPVSSSQVAYVFHDDFVQRLIFPLKNDRQVLDSTPTNGNAQNSAA